MWNEKLSWKANEQMRVNTLLVKYRSGFQTDDSWKQKKYIFFYRCNRQNPYLAQIHCSSGMTPGLNQGLGGFIWWLLTDDENFSFSPKKARPAATHTPKTTPHTGGSQHWPAWGLYTDSASLPCICHLSLPDSSSHRRTWSSVPSSWPTAETQCLMDTGGTGVIMMLDAPVSVGGGFVGKKLWLCWENSGLIQQKGM